MPDEPRLHPRQPAPHTQPVYIWPTPERADLVFWVEKDGRLPKNTQWRFGDPYDDQVKYPDHKLVHVTPEEPGRWAKWYYASDRINEDAYNWESVVADIGGTKFDAVTRTYMIPRADYNPEDPPMGAPMPNAPAGKWTAGHVLAEKSQKRTGDQTFDSLYVMEQRTYVKRVSMRTLGVKEGSSRLSHEDDNLYYLGETVPGTGKKVEALFANLQDPFWGVNADGSTNVGKQLSENWFLITNRDVTTAGGTGGGTGANEIIHKIWPTPENADMVFWVERDGRVADNQVWDYGDPYRGAASYPNHFLIHVSPEDEDKWSKWYYAAKRLNQENYNWESVNADIGGAKFDAVSRTFMIKRADFSFTSPKMGDALANIPNGLFGTGFVLAERAQKRTGDEQFDSMFVIETRTYVKRANIRRLGIDELNGKMLTADDNLYFRGEDVAVGAGSIKVENLFGNPANTFWGLQTNGTQNVGKQLSTNWFLITNEQVIGGDFVGGVVEVDSYEVNDNYSWPRVLQEVGFYGWVKRSGGEDLHPYIKWAKDAYSGPCLTTITRKWSKSPFSISQVDTMWPTAIDYSCPLFNISVPACLHGEWSFWCDFGNNDPRYEMSSGSKQTFPATTPDDWPGSVVAYDDQTQFRGGYLRTTRVVTAPSPPSPIPKPLDKPPE